MKLMSVMSYINSCCASVAANKSTEVARSAVNTFIFTKQLTCECMSVLLNTCLHKQEVNVRTGVDCLFGTLIIGSNELYVISMFVRMLHAANDISKVFMHRCACANNA